MMRTYQKNAIDRARDGALDWLKEHGDGYPRSWEQEAKDDIRRGYVMYDEFEAPPIAGYESLEQEGLVVRLEIAITARNEERVHFRLNGQSPQRD